MKLLYLGFLLTIIIISLFINNISEPYDNISNKNTLSLLSIFKNESMNLKLWIEHYISEGVNKFYLIDNGSTDNPLDILNEYIQNGKVNYYYLPEPNKQVEHYRNIIVNENLKENTEWLIICDLDEFYYGYPKKLVETLNEYKNYDIVYSNWRMFGSDGHKKHPDNIIKSIIWREPDFSETKKFIFQPSKIDDFNKLTVHYIKENDNSILENDKIRLNHYPIQSEEFFITVKMTRGDVAFKEWDTIRDMNYFYKYDKNKTYKDDVLANLQYE